MYSHTLRDTMTRALQSRADHCADMIAQNSDTVVPDYWVHEKDRCEAMIRFIEQIEGDVRAQMEIEEIAYRLDVDDELEELN